MSKVKFYRCDEKVFSIREFLEYYVDQITLSKIERIILDRVFPDIIPEYLQIPRTRAAWLGNKNEYIWVTSHGQRSSYWAKHKIKFKGCTPSHEPSVFPLELSFFGKEKAEVETIPYGILTAEHVIREILGHAFFERCRLKTNTEPVCVYTQKDGFCLVLGTLGEKRIESFFNFREMSISDLIEQDQIRKSLGLMGDLSQEVGLKGINICNYTFKKAKLLTAMNFNGGFRGLLNSNIGNDVMVKEDLYLCDFDTFSVVEIPENPDKTFMKRFYLQCFIEAIKGSLPIIDIACDKKEAMEKYFTISSLYHSYRRLFFEHVKRKEWDINEFFEIEKWAQDTPIFKRTVEEIVLSYDKIKDIPDREPIYVPH